MTVFDIEPIVFNGNTFKHVELTDSAKEHFGDDSEKYYRNIASSLDGQHIPIAEYGRDNQPIWHLGSCTTMVRGIYAQSDYRDSLLRTFPEKQTLHFFHGCSITEKQYEKIVKQNKH